ncbi:TetR/AcrR family transcriptional regulator [Aestuariirhabdus sp. Z084]|uniref:TetR/AcrR family transcriptional regulator n=1 Tax=Aestuariirhabdus haliotis TaxID=2918751 RepID=UPI00201B45D6|nr:TetR/AcrR family transcriptional regulator [Aestuariirhabdus haliotis]MCL6416606.1 TetR/AcrR family transcriptional regulator [Aestuariirhabdus haliotis]MCL6420641.1 TetR/AcrR family transcriptional regulator [Aestuariirhabdus haliotis]
MPRPKTYNEEAVLTSAMLCFWRKGHAATSMKDLEAATRLTPGSLYNSFGSKDGLFLKVLDHYIDCVVRHRVERFLLQGDPVKGIEQFFLDCFKPRAAYDGLGCLLINTSTELGPHDEAVRQKVAMGMKQAEKGLISALQRAQQVGALPATIDAQARAAHLGLLMNGMLVSSQVATNRRWLTPAMASVRALLH